MQSLQNERATSIPGLSAPLLAIAKVNTCTCTCVVMDWDVERTAVTANSTIRFNPMVNSNSLITRATDLPAASGRSQERKLVDHHNGPFALCCR